MQKQSSVKVSDALGERKQLCDLSSGNVGRIGGEACRDRPRLSIVHGHCATLSMKVFQMIGQRIDGLTGKPREELKSKAASSKHKII